MTTATVSADTTRTTRTVSAPPRRMGRSVGAVAAGLVSVIVLSTATDAVLHATGVFPPMGYVMSDALFVLAAAYRCAFNVAGAYLTASLAPARPMKHVLILGCIGITLATLGLLATLGKGPAFGPLWYPLSLVVTALPTVLAGARLHDLRVEASRRTHHE